MGLPAKLLADGERPLVVLRPHVRRLARPALILLVLAPVASFAIAAVPRSAAQAPARLVVAALAVLVTARWVVLPFLLWWNTLYVLTEERVFERQGVVRRSGHDLPLRGVTDVLVSQKLGERLLRSGTLTVTTGGGRDLVLTDVPAVARLQRSLHAVADHLAERDRAMYEQGQDALRADELNVIDAEVGAEVAGDLDEELASGWDGAGWDGDHWQGDRWDADHWDEEAPAGPSRREARRRGRESARRLKALQAEVRRAPRPDSPLEDDGVEPAQAAPSDPPAVSLPTPANSPDASPDPPSGRLPASSPATPSPTDPSAGDRSDDASADSAEEGRQEQGARILRFPRRP